jgi:hypothetical protein
MIRKFGLVGAVAGVALAVQTSGAWAQYFTPDGVDGKDLRCDLWHLPDDKAGTQRRLFVHQLVIRELLGYKVDVPVAFSGYFDHEGVRYTGTFAIPLRVPLAFWSDPNGKDPTPLFTTRKGSTIEFLAPEGAKAAIGEVTFGYLTQKFDTRSSIIPLPSIPCTRPPDVVAGDPSEAKGPSRDKTGKPPGPRSNPGIVIRIEPDGPKIAELFKTPATPVRPGAENPRTESDLKSEPKAEPKAAPHPTPDYSKRPGSLTDNIPGVVPTTPVAPPSLKKIVEGEVAPAVPAPAPSPIPGSPAAPAPAASTPPPPPPAPSVPTPTSEAPLPQVCAAEDFKSLTALSGITNRQMVGLRNSKIDIDAWSYVRDPYVRDLDDASPVSFTFDLGASVDRLIPYEPVALPRTKLLVAPIPKLSWEQDAKPKNASPAKPGTAVRIMVVGGPQEIAVSGLDKLGGELKKLNKNIKVDVHWYDVDTASGSLRAAKQFESFGALVKAAREHAGDGRLALLDEGQINTLLESFERELLKAQSTPFDKVFWIKGGYPVASSFPARLEHLIITASASPAIVPNAANVRSGWLVVVSAKGYGLSDAYIQVPVSSQSAGDVIIEEADSEKGGQRHLIGDKDMTKLSTSLNIAGNRRLKAAGVAPAPAGAETPTGDPVLEADEAFAERGYLLSKDLTVKLRKHLRRVADLWSETNGAPIKADVLRDIENDLNKTNPTLLDLLQDDTDGVALKLPKLPPEWGKILLKNLNAPQREQARAFVDHYLAGTRWLEEQFTKKHEGCELLFVRDERLFAAPEPALRR